MKRNGLRQTLVVFVCLLLLVPALCLSARAEAVYVSFSDPYVTVNGSVTVTVHASVPVAGVGLNLVYDTEYLSYVGHSGGMGNAVVNAGGGSISIVDYDSSSQSDFTLNLSFNALKQGSTTIRVAACSVSDAGGDAMDASWGSSVVTITSASSDATLQSLSINPGVLSPAFSPEVTQYSTTVSHDTTWIAVTAIKNDPAAYPYVDGHAALNVGQNTVTVTVTAGDGSQKVYTILVTRQAAAAPEATPIPQTTTPPDTQSSPEPTATAQPRTVYAKVSDGSRVEIGSFADGQIPTGFETVELSFNGVPVQAVRSQDGERTAVYLLGNAGNVAGFYLFDAETGVAKPMNEWKNAQKVYTLLDAADYEGEAPEGCVLQGYELEGVATRVYVPEAVSAGYVVFYGRADGAEPRLFVYDTVERTVQRYGISFPRSTPEPTVQPGLGANEEAVLRDELAGAKSQAQTMKRAAEVSTVAALALLVAVVVLAYTLVKKRMEERRGE